MKTCEMSDAICDWRRRAMRVYKIRKQEKPNRFQSGLERAKSATTKAAYTGLGNRFLGNSNQHGHNDL
jgi:hypothetical protein